MGGRDKAFAAVERRAHRGAHRAPLPGSVPAGHRRDEPPRALRALRRRDGRRPSIPAAARSPASTPPCWRAAHPVALRRRVRHAGARRRRDPLAARPPARRPTPSCRAGTTTSSRCTRSTPSTRCRWSRRCLAPDGTRCASSCRAIRVDYVDEDELRALARRGAQPAQREHARGARRARRPLRRGRALSARTTPATSWSTSSTTPAAPSASSRDARCARARLPHRSTYILVFDGRGELFVHLRTATKDVYPSHWDPCVGGVLVGRRGLRRRRARASCARSSA